MVASVDGSTVIDGRSGALSGPTDQRMLAALRACADVVLVGAGTVRAEGYGPPKRAGLRVGVVTRTGNVDLDGPLFRSGAGFLVLPEDSPARAEIDRAGVDAVNAGHSTVDLAAAIRRLPGDPAVVHVEGGPSLNGALIRTGLVDELNVTTSPMLAGGDGPRLATTPEAIGQRLTLSHLAIDDEGFVFTRWLRADASAG